MWLSSKEILPQMLLQSPTRPRTYPQGCLRTQANSGALPNAIYFEYKTSHFLITHQAGLVDLVGLTDPGLPKRSLVRPGRPQLSGQQGPKEGAWDRGGGPRQVATGLPQ